MSMNNTKPLPINGIEKLPSLNNSNEQLMFSSHSITSSQLHNSQESTSGYNELIVNEDDISTDEEEGFEMISRPRHGNSNVNLLTTHQSSADSNLNQFKFNRNSFEGQLLLEERNSGITMQVYKNETAVREGGSFKLHQAPLIFFERCETNVFYCKKHVEDVYNLANIQTTIVRNGGNTFKMTAEKLTLLKSGFESIQNNSEGFQTKLPFRANQLALVSYKDLIKVAKKKQHEEQWKESEVSSFYKHKFIILIKGANP